MSKELKPTTQAAPSPIIWFRCMHCYRSRGIPLDKLVEVAPAKGGLRSMKCEKCGAEMVMR